MAPRRKPDAEAAKRRAAFSKVRKAERTYARQLRKVARHVGDIIKGHEIDSEEAANELRGVLGKYADLIEPWAKATAARMLADVSNRDEKAWDEHSKGMGRALRSEIATAPTGRFLQEKLSANVKLIKSLPTEAAERVKGLTLEAMFNASRSSEIAKEIAKSGEVTASRANVIARTEVAGAASGLVEARARHVGSEGYIWRTAGDSDVRPSHRLNGKFFAWDNPPTLDGMTGHAGHFPNCFPGSTKVSLTNGCHYLWRRWYEGPLVVVEFVGGFLELTPNHPILTGRGWIAAKDIETSDYIIQSIGDRRFALEDDKDQGQPTFDEIFASLDALVGRERQLGLLFDFHGDRPDDDVDTVRADHLLPGYGEAPLFESICNFVLSGTDGGMGVSPDRRSLHIGKADGPSRVNQAASGVNRHGLHPANVRLRTGSALDTVPFQNFRDRSTIATDAQRDSELALAGSISLDDRRLQKIRSSLRRRHSALDFDTTLAEPLADDVRIDPYGSGGLLYSRPRRYEAVRVVNKSVRNFSDHVFTMQTANGWFTVTSAGIVVKNCRCYPEPVIPDDI